jgi:hypothetical protein
MTTVPGIPWSPQEAAAINDFLNQPLGRKWLGILLSRKPRVDISTNERAALTGVFSAGYEHFFSEIAMTRVARTEEEPANIRSMDMVKD